MKEEISKILNIPITDDWEIFDNYESLYLVHYSKNSDLKKFGYLKGYIVNIETKEVIQSGSGYSYKIVSDSIHIKENKIYLSESRRDFVLDATKTKITHGVEGKWFYVHKYKGQILYTSSKMINDQSLSYLNLEVKDGECDYYILMDKSTMIASRYNPRLTDVGYTLFYIRTVDEQGKIKYNEYPEDAPFETTLGPTIVKQIELGINEVNSYLRFGAYQEIEDDKLDIRLRPGEFVYVNDGVNLIEVMSTSYGWRKSISYGGSSTDHYYNFICNINLSYIRTHTKEGLDDYMRLLPIFKPIEPKTLKDNPLIIWKEENLQSNVDNRQKNIQNIFYAFLASVPPFRQIESIDILDRFERDKDKLFKVIKRIFDDNSNHSINRRVRDIIRIAIDWGVDTFVKPENTRPLTQIIYHNIKLIIRKEDPKSLYKLFKEFNII